MKPMALHPSFALSITRFTRKPCALGAGAVRIFSLQLQINLWDAHHKEQRRSWRLRINSLFEKLMNFIDFLTFCLSFSRIPIIFHCMRQRIRNDDEWTLLFSKLFWVRNALPNYFQLIIISWCWCSCYMDFWICGLSASRVSVCLQIDAKIYWNTFE